MEETDACLLHAAAEGDREAFGRFVRRHTDAILRYCMLRLKNRFDGEDAVQEAMLRLYAQIRRGQMPHDPLPWLFGVARHCCQESLRRRNRERREALPETDCPPSSNSLDHSLDELHEAMWTLGDFEAAVLHMKHTEGLRCRQISQLTGKPLGTITATLSRAYAKLREILDRENKR